MMQAGTMTGGIVGPLFGGVLSTYFGQRMSFVIAGVFILIATIAVIIWVHEGKGSTESNRTAQSKMKIREVLRNGQLTSLLLLLLVFQLAMNMIQPLLTLHIADLRGSIQGAVLSSGLVFALIGVAGILSSPVWGRAGERKGQPYVLTICLMLSGLVLGLQYFVHELWLFTMVQFIFGLFMAGVTPNINTLMVRNTDDAFRGRSFGLTTSANQFGAMIGPLIGGGLGYFLNIQWIFVTAGIILVSAGITVYLRNAKTDLEIGAIQSGNG